MLELTLQANINGWPDFCQRRSSAAFKKTKESIFKRDNYSCQFCGFRAKSYQQVLNQDGNYQRNTPENLVTSCVLCAQCHFLGCGRFGTIIYLPEYSQVELNHLSRALFCAMRDDVPYRDTARTLQRSFHNRSKQVDELFGLDASDSMIFGQSMVDIAMTNMTKTADVFQVLRLLPFRTALEKPIQYWSTLLNSHM